MIDRLSSRTVVAVLDRAVEDVVARAATRLYDAETALHVARQSRVDRWVAAAYDRLHEAFEEYRRAVALRDSAA
jgi:hypothetical protein